MWDTEPESEMTTTVTGFVFRAMAILLLLLVICYPVWLLTGWFAVWLVLVICTTIMGFGCVVGLCAFLVYAILQMGK